MANSRIVSIILLPELITFHRILRLYKQLENPKNGKEKFLPIATLMFTATSYAKTTMKDSKLSNFDVTMVNKVIELASVSQLGKMFLNQGHPAN